MPVGRVRSETRGAKLGIYKRDRRKGRVDFGTNLKMIREARGLSQRQLASQVPIAQSQLAAYERNTQQPRIETAQSLADGLQVPLVVLYLPHGSPEMKVILDTTLKVSQNLEAIA